LERPVVIADRAEAAGEAHGLAPGVEVVGKVKLLFRAGPVPADPHGAHLPRRIHLWGALLGCGGRVRRFRRRTQEYFVPGSRQFEATRGGYPVERVRLL